MSQENVELLHRGFAAWRRRDLDTVLASSHPDAPISPVMGPASTSYGGVLEARDLGDFVLGTVLIRGQGVGSLVLSEQTVWYASEWRDGKLLCYRAYESESEALEAVGL